MGRWVFEGVEYASRGLMCKARRERYVEYLDSGLNFTQAAKAVGVSKRTGKVWRNGRTRATGRNEKASVDWYRSAMDRPKKIHPRYLSQDERMSIADRRLAGDSIRGIARNTNPATGAYEPYRAQQMSADRLRRPKTAKAHAVPGLLDYIRDGLRAHWSPEQIGGMLRRDFPDNGDMHVCTETIYQAIYVQAKGELRREVSRALRSGRTARRARNDGNERRPRFREPMVMISERPPEVEDRAVPGHWEGDLIMGANNRSAIGTLVERSTRFLILLHLPDGHDAEHVQQAVIDQMGRLPKHLRNSLTWDQGSELALHKRISTALDMDVYFCDPHSPWQRGTNENTNGLLRQYFPKGTDLGGYSQAYLDAVAEEMNDRPRKTLGFRKPSEAILDLINAA
ncbi:IS30 family transposase [Bifidobacterium callitrichidarum]|uniref:IS30 family transposase n=1 Tax=Bifidobacterium callitrichidarum TaxID=2052941 RepID=A0A2U2NAI1_9BIFI|nr:IS30 family transposase [Bifidobacterium callitrichidarum]